MTTLLAAGRAVGTGASEERKPSFSFLSLTYFQLQLIPSETDDCSLVAVNPVSSHR
jgi:hypothetical protein